MMPEVLENYSSNLILQTHTVYTMHVIKTLLTILVCLHLLKFSNQTCSFSSEIMSQAPMGTLKALYSLAWQPHSHMYTQAHAANICTTAATLIQAYNIYNNTIGKHRGHIKHTHALTHTPNMYTHTFTNGIQTGLNQILSQH